MRKKPVKTLTVGILTTLLLASACSNGNNGSNGNTGNTGNTGSKSDTPAVSGNAGADANANKPASGMEEGPFGKYDPPITMTTVRSLPDVEEYRKGESLDDNLWTKDFSSILGINVVNKWKVNNKQYNNKITVSMISGDMPDFYQVDSKQLQQIVDAGQAADLTEIYEKYASDVTKQSFEEFGGIKLQGATFDGKLMALPLNGGMPGAAQMIWIRADWLKNLGLEPPKTMDDVNKIALAFTKDDPDQNGKNDTIGLNLMKDLFGGWAGIDGYLNGYHAYAFNPANASGTELIIRKDADGKPILGDTLPEVKTALGHLRDLYAAGAINKEFSVLDPSKAGDLATTSKVGMSYGEFWVGTWPINNMKKEDPKVDWKPYPIVSSDDQPVHPTGRGDVPTSFIVVNKNSKHPEAAMKILNYFHEKVSGPNKDEAYHQVKEGDKNYQVFGLSPIVGPGFSNTNQTDNDLIQDALKTGDESKLTPSAMVYYKGIKEYQAGNMEMWFWNALFGPGGAYSITNDYDKNSPPVTSEYLGQPTLSMVSKGPILRDLEIKVFTEIINGTRPLDDFDTAFVAEWNKQGGQDILKEIAESGRLK
ncbi:extracellular solute-binding protein [Paenibacillus sacheonensis]|uniref:Extracellular solute-binding protein n=1 Tax=Paenibacillus sacheonensis TaxID=742054 RepID=A0A7X4YWF8_9BACL|nr:extracellular solute-binding protein [Paenibacillus sacheonensis]MBM7567259.1 putative aldouronate transport system substrate-binding protein [Paenibacillus sacheonensis]NBC72846.1 extracellular solute-binding protein [Paenibacillus sacheonensis]